VCVLVCKSNLLLYTHTHTDTHTHTHTYIHTDGSQTIVYPLLLELIFKLMTRSKTPVLNQAVLQDMRFLLTNLGVCVLCVCGVCVVCVLCVCVVCVLCVVCVVCCVCCVCMCCVCMYSVCMCVMRVCVGMQTHTYVSEFFLCLLFVCVCVSMCVCVCVYVCVYVCVFILGNKKLFVSQFGWQRWLFDLMYTETINLHTHTQTPPQTHKPIHTRTHSLSFVPSPLSCTSREQMPSATVLAYSLHMLGVCVCVCVVCVYVCMLIFVCGYLCLLLFFIYILLLWLVIKLFFFIFFMIVINYYY